jgi:formylglycine-generating enzyme required for sulfatase activity
MGCDKGRSDEQPVHEVWVDGFAMAVTTVTNAQFLEFVRDTGGQMPRAFNEARFEKPQQPVVAVTWFEAMAYCHWLTQKTGQLFRLPTEAEWERAVRAGSEGGLYPWGDESPDTFELYRSGWRDESPHEVGLHPPNRWGLHDLGDNVHEWCLDWYDPDFYRRPVSRNPINLTPASRRASRGGSWRHQIKVSRCAARSSLSPGFGYTDYGFRVVSVVGKGDPACWGAE